MQFRQLVLRNVFWRGGYLFSVLILNILIARYFKAEGSGWIFYVVNNLSFLLLLAGLSLESGASFFLARSEIDPGKIATVCLLWSILAATIVGWMVFEFHPFPSEFLSNQRLLVGSVTYAMGILLVTYYSTLFYAKLEFFFPNAIPLFVNAGLIFLLLISHQLPFFHRHFVMTYFSSFLIMGMMMVTAHYVLYRTKKSFFVLPSWLEFKPILRYSILALAANIVFFLVYRVDYWFVKIYCTDHDLGNYIQVSKLGQLFLLLPNVISNNIFPSTASGQRPMIHQEVQFLSRNLVLLFLFFAIGIGFSGHWLFPVLFGKSFDAMYIPFLLLIPGILGLVVQSLLSAYFAGKNRIYVNLFGSIIALVVIIIADSIFIPSYGIRAAALISSVGYLIIPLYSLMKYNKEFKEDQILDFIVPRRTDFYWLAQIRQSFNIYRRKK
jgi:O-antigen/teichoic acid export membrane protein